MCSNIMDWNYWLWLQIKIWSSSLLWIIIVIRGRDLEKVVPYIFIYATSEAPSGEEEHDHLMTSSYRETFGARDHIKQQHLNLFV